MFDLHSKLLTNGTEFDIESIMLYFFPKSWTITGLEVKQNTKMSAKDKLWCATKYPGIAAPPPPPVGGWGKSIIQIPGKPDVSVVFPI